MPGGSPRSSEAIRDELYAFLHDFKSVLESDDLRAKVKNLVPAFRMLRDLGSSLVDINLSMAAKERILAYFLRFPQVPINGDELMVVSGIGEWARRIRELRVQEGWSILSGKTAKEMQEEGELDIPGDAVGRLRVTDYILISTEQDREAAHRWHMANAIRRSTGGVRDKVLQFLRRNVGKNVTGEELRYVANDRREWTRRVRELRTELGWPVVTKNSGRPDLPVGVYVLEADRQGPAHDRAIPDSVRVEVLTRDGFACTHPGCGWTVSHRQPGDPRQFLELHHLQRHVEGGANDPANLITLCNVHHDVIHAND